MADFSVNERSTDSGRTVLELVGELDLAAASQMRAVGLATLAEPTCTNLVLDVSALTFVDSTGIGSWVELRNHAHQQDQLLALRGVSENLARILSIAGLTALFDVDPPGVDQQ